MDSIILALLVQVFTVYTVTLLICSSSLLAPIRQFIILKTPFLYSPLSKWFNYQFEPGMLHPIECRMCTGFWVSLATCLYYHNLSQLWIIYGLSYFLATQER